MRWRSRAWRQGPPVADHQDFRDGALASQSHRAIRWPGAGALRIAAFSTLPTPKRSRRRGAQRGPTLKRE